jgi:hypothetical protein
LNGFEWRPGVGAAADALQRLSRAFKRPREAMGEAWFMGDDRRMYHELRGDLAALSTDLFQHVLEEIASGIRCFGHHREWDEWFHYLLARLIPRGHEHDGSPLLESLVSTFMVLYPNGVYREPYAGFLADLLCTLGRCMMAPECWNGQQALLGRFLHRSNHNAREVWGWCNASGDLSASLYFCLKYLPPDCVARWFMSVLAIESPYWRAQLIVWLVGSNDMLQGRMLWPCELDGCAYPSVTWAYSHGLRPDLAKTDESGAPAVQAFLPEAARDAVLTVVRSHFTETVFLEWLESIGEVPELQAELAEIPSAFEALYVNRGIVTAAR